MTVKPLKDFLQDLVRVHERFGNLDVIYDGMWTIGNIRDPEDYIQLELFDRIARDSQSYELQRLRAKVAHLEAYCESADPGAGLSMFGTRPWDT